MMARSRKKDTHMRKPPILAGFIAATLAGSGAGLGIAHAQQPPASPPHMGAGPQGMGAGPGPHHPPGPGHMQWGHPGPHGMMMMRGMMHPPKAAVFMFRRGNERVMIKCADDEPTKACVDAATTLLGKLAPAAGTTGGATTQ